MSLTRNAGLITGIAVVLAGFWTTPAFANTVALSVNEMTAFGMSFSGANTFSGFTFSNSTAATESGGTGNSGLQDAPTSCVGSCGGWTNEFFGHASPSEFSYGDAQILDTNVLAGNGAASSIGEALVIDGLAHAAGSNVMTAGFTVENNGTLIDFGFTADPRLTTQIGAGGISAAANMFFNISISDGTTTVFSWSPDGAGGITGGSVSADPFSLNRGISGSTSYDPLGAAFAAQTAGLQSGVAYTLNIKMENQVNGSSAVVPVPAAIWLFGTGLLGLAGFARRRS